jgi:hypothetical protein
LRLVRDDAIWVDVGILVSINPLNDRDVPLDQGVGPLVFEREQILFSGRDLSPTA